MKPAAVFVAAMLTLSAVESANTTTTPTPAPTSECPVQFCNAIGANVCGSNNKTYGNECMLREAKCAGETSLKIAYTGECNASGGGNHTGGGNGNGTGGGNRTGGSNSTIEPTKPSPTPTPTGGASGVRVATAFVVSSALLLIAVVA